MRVCVQLLLVLMAGPALLGAQEREWTPEQRSVIDAVREGPVGIDTDFDRWESVGSMNVGSTRGHSRLWERGSQRESVPKS